MDGLVRLVRDNLVYYHLWTNVKALPIRAGHVLGGLPPSQLSNDDSEITTEYVYPVQLKQYKSGNLTLQLLDEIFVDLQDVSCKRIILGIVNDDGTVVYYTVYKGLHKPKKN
ncbi:HDR147Wp [Eremothecium sinecaudum]|uniref:HDR147Wp n=1 Tax=Eremothecium sinecaudum TaxID=45286 RepID=A0A0X8HSZ9_9SACH|nr:HDR147Wp [Eremothecium sinecaudum]AMD20889.1 HDR147Wp [Eremothecium sinecaudum]